MAEKKEKEGFLSGLVKKEFVVETLKRLVETATKSLEESVERIVDFATRKAYAFLFMLLGAIFLLVGVAMVFDSSLALPRGTGFLIIGAVAILAGFLFKASIRRR